MNRDEERKAFDNLVLAIERYSEFQEGNNVLWKDSNRLIDDDDVITEHMLIGCNSKGEYADELTLVIRYIPHERLKKNE